MLKRCFEAEKNNLIEGYSDKSLFCMMKFQFVSSSAKFLHNQ